MIRFLERAYRLKDEPRNGWLLRGVDDPESVAGHSWGTAFLCLLYGERERVDVSRAVAMALVHDLAEAITTDFPNVERGQGDGERRKLKARLEEAAMRELLEDFDGESVRRLWLEYEERATREAVFVRDMNLVDMCVQALLYEREGRVAGIGSGAGGRGSLDEFLESARSRLGTATGRALYLEVEAEYRGLTGR